VTVIEYASFRLAVIRLAITQGGPIIVSEEGQGWREIFSFSELTHDSINLDVPLEIV
jgi:hypothetical protein